ncbi:MAG: hypothetical protein KAR06_07235 [Deltaproteobacteria bacterium]|nr:hypothetical protein [Deltaproteobacteria bacterium]
MDKEFKQPDFNGRDIELSLSDNEVCVYATEAGLKKLIDFCQALIDKPQEGHIHLEDYEVLTQDSLNGVIAVFGSNEV